MPKQSIRTLLAIKPAVVFSACFVILIFAIIVGVSFGSVHVPFFTVVEIFWSKLLQRPLNSAQADSALYQNIVMNIRLPRVILAGLVGASLAIAGAAFQGLLRNPLADPYTLGVSSGASVGAVMTLFFHLTIPFLEAFTLPVISIVCSFVTMMIVLFFAHRLDRALRVETIILTGIIFSSFLGALISLMIALTGEELRQIIGWLLGSVSMRGWEHIRIILPFFILGSLILLYFANELNVLSFGEEQASHLGVAVQRDKMLILIAASVLTGAAVAVSGTIGFVGLVVPHFIRLFTGPNHRYLLPISLLIGASFLIITDLIARTIIAPVELPIGVMTALVGAPVFAIILMRKRRKGR